MLWWGAMPRPVSVLALRWLAWATVNRLGQDAIKSVTRLVLAGFLWPEAFGLFALAVAVVTGLRVACQLEFGRALVQRRQLTPQILDTAYWTQVVLGVAGSALLLGVAGPIAGLTGSPGLAPLLQVLGLQLVLDGLSGVPRAWLWREAAFRQLAGRGVVSGAVGAGAAVATALAGGGVWSFVVQELVADVVELGLLWMLVPWRPGLSWSPRAFVELLRFGSPLLGRKGLEYFTQHGDRFLVGRVFGPEVLGVYAFALRAVEAVSLGIGAIFERVAFTTFARIQDDMARSRRGFMEAVRLQALLTVPALVSVAVLARELVPPLLGPTWSGVVPFVPIFAIQALAGSLLAVPRATLTGRGRPWLVFTFAACGALAFAAAWLLSLPWGPLGVAIGGVAAATALVPIALGMVTLEVPFPLRDWCRALLPAAVGGAAMLLGMWTVGGIVPLAEGLTRAAGMLLAGAICYVAVVASMSWGTITGWVMRSPAS
jgi:O-antigen/teichoic acid export membrane protein